VKKKVPGAEAVEKLKKNPTRLLITILIGNNLVNVGASALATSIAFDLSMSYAVGITTGIMTLVILVFGEITPKSLAVKHNEGICLVVANPIRAIQFILYPVVSFFEWMTDTITSGFGKRRKPLITEEEIKTFVTIGEETGVVKESERVLIDKVFVFTDLTAKDVMTPRNKVIAVPKSRKISEIAPIYHKKGHTRLPVYDRNLDSIEGFVHMMDAQKAIVNGKKNAKITTIMRAIPFVPASKKLDTLLKFFQRKKLHIAVVVDEFGANIGIVSIEDVLEEIVGEIIDEKEKIEPMVRDLGKGKFIAKGDADIDEINSACGLKLPEEEGPYTIASHILHRIGRIPAEGEFLDFPECNIKIEEMEKNKINSVVISKKQKARQ
jgi:CBS domain containing-hemolysin-like protein